MGASDWVTAGAAAVTAAVTGVYAWFTWRLWQETRRQATITQTMLEVSQKPNLLIELFLDTGTTPNSLYIETTFHNYGPVSAVVTGVEVRLLDGERELGKRENATPINLYVVAGQKESRLWNFGDGGTWGTLKRFSVEGTVKYSGPLKAYMFRALAPLDRPEVNLTMKYGPLKIERSELLELQDGAELDRAPSS